MVTEHHQWTNLSINLLRNESIASLLVMLSKITKEEKKAKGEEKREGKS